MNPAQALPHDATPRRSSIVAHPWFPRLIGLWCAALFGLCSLALAPEMLERIVATLGIDRIVSAAAPPLGQTARLLLALGLSGVGEIVGLVIGKRLATSRLSPSARQRWLKSARTKTAESDDAPSLRPRDRHADAPARKPLSASSELGDEAATDLAGIDTTLPSGTLASDANREPGPCFKVAPLPGGEFWQSAEIDGGEDQQTVEAEPQDPVDGAQAVPVDAFELGLSDAPSGYQPEAHGADAPAILSARFSSLLAPPPAASAPLTAASLDQLGVVQLSERLALALQARRARRAQAPGAALSIDAPTETSAPAGLEILARRAPKPDFEYDAEMIRADGPTDAEIEDSEEFSDDTLEEGYSSLLAIGSGFQRPQAVRIEQPHGDEIEPVVIFPGQGARGAGEAAHPTSSSPIAPYARPTLANSSAEAPATTEPGNQANPEDTDRALRAALASLQRISGAR